MSEITTSGNDRNALYMM